MERKVLIVGGVAGGASTAARLRRLDENINIVMFEKGEAISYANCGLPYYIGGIIEERDALFIQTPEAMRRRFNIDVRVRHEVIRIDREKREVLVKDLQNGQTYREQYDQLVLATGSTPIIPQVPGIDLPKVFTLRNIPDTDRIKQYVAENQINSAVVIGGGFIGLEMAENLVHLNKKVYLVEMANQVLNNLDFEMAVMVHRELKQNGIELILGNGMTAINQTPSGLEVLLNDGQKLNTDMVILAVGVRPETKLAVESGLEIGSTRGIRVNERLQTSDPNVFALGDAVEIKEKISGNEYWAPLAGPANRQGRLLADVLGGRSGVYQGVQGTAIVKAFDLDAGSTGLNEKTLQKWGFDYQSSITHSNSHASYYPGAKPLTIKLLFAPDSGTIYGAQVVGYEGVDKRLDVLATAIRFAKTVYDLVDLELAYAPPFSSAKDPVNIAGYTATNFIENDMDIITWKQLISEEGNDRFILDVREPAEVQIGSISGAVNIPLNSLRHRLEELPKNKEIVVYCQVGLRAYLAVRILLQHGFTKVKNLSGGYKTFHLVEAEYRQLQQLESLKPLTPLTAQSNENQTNQQTASLKAIKLKACGLQCPGPILQVFNKMQQLEEGEILEVSASDPGFANDIESWCLRTGNTLLNLERNADKIIALIRKGTDEKGALRQTGVVPTQDKTIVVFSGDLDKALASFVIATGAASMGRKVIMFFTFWGLNVLRKPKKVKVTKGVLDKMFGMMMPRGSEKLGLSQMNMGGLGPQMIRMVMNRKNVASLESMISQTQMLGIKMIACQMSMDVMGIKKEELLDGVEIGGVASYLAAAEESNVNLFI